MKPNCQNKNTNYLNLGCGYRFNSKWTNVDFISTGKDVIAYDLTKGIPFDENTFDLVYHSHLLEHFPKTTAETFMKECHRVLKPQGILRVVVPDFEQIVRIYLMALEKAIAGSDEWAANYEWILLEIFDQMIRNNRGGDMAVYLSKKRISNEEFVIKRFGLEAQCLLKQKHQSENKVKYLSRQFKQFIVKFRKLLPKLLSQLYTAIQIGYFRQSGEIHQWMYDRYSLSLLLEKSGFKNITQCTATDSYILDWNSFAIDTEPDGSVYKPDSLFMEAIK
jgi:predicted SAM-dependent methyltransferase